MNQQAYEHARSILMGLVHDADDPMAAVNLIREILHEVSPCSGQPVDFVRWVPIDDVEPNDYNPNAVAVKEMGLLLTSVLADNYTQPVVTVWDQARGKYVVVDGFHRYFICKMNEEVRTRCHGMLPIVVIEKGIADRRASTVRHNRARGKHSVTGMAKMVFDLRQDGWSGEDICNKLGMQPEEVARLEHITGFSKLFESAEYARAWETRHQVLHRLKQQQSDGLARSMRQSVEDAE